MRREVVENAKLKKGEYGVVDNLFKDDDEKLKGGIKFKPVVGDPILKKLEIDNNPMEEKVIEVKFPDP